jgi:hypothetical protein
MRKVSWFSFHWLGGKVARVWLRAALKNTGPWHGRAGEVGSPIVGVRCRSSTQGGRHAIPPARFPEQRAAERSGSWKSCAPNRLFNRIGHDGWVVKNIPQLYARNAPATAIRSYVSVLYGLAMTVEGARQIQRLP